MLSVPIEDRWLSRPVVCQIGHLGGGIISNFDCCFDRLYSGHIQVHAIEHIDDTVHLSVPLRMVPLCQKPPVPFNRIMMSQGPQTPPACRQVAGDDRYAEFRLQSR